MKPNLDTKTINVHVLLFASFGDFLSANKLDIDIEQNSTIKDLQEVLLKKCSPSKKWNKPLLYAVNQTFATLDVKLNHGDEVVFMPFVSGG
jgi:molybdopterin converting factor small subunit